MRKKPPAPAPQPDEPAKRPARKKAGTPTPLPKKCAPAPPIKNKKAAKPLPPKKAVEKKSAPDADPSALAKNLMARASKTAGRAVRNNPAPTQAAAAPIPDDDATDDAGPLMGCTPRQARFVDLYLSLGFNATQAYKEAGFQVKSDAVACAAASRLLASVKVREYLAVRAKAMMDRTEGEQDRLMLTLTGAAFVDANELVSYHRGACRYCYGQKHRYQFTAGEWDRKLEVHEARREAALAKERADPGPLDIQGGTGYDKRKEPYSDCPECFGEGVGWQVIKDTRHLSPAARALYAGVKDSKEGLQVLAHSQERARETLAKIHRMYEEGGNVNLLFNGEELSRKFEDKMAKSRARGAAMREERFGKPDGGSPAG